MVVKCINGEGGEEKENQSFDTVIEDPQKSPSNASNADGKGDGWSFGNMMHMMMMQNCMDNEGGSSSTKANSTSGTRSTSFVAKRW